MGSRGLLAAVGLLAAIATAAGAATAIDSIRAGGTRAPVLDPRKSNLDVAAARGFGGFPLYWLGESFADLPLTSIQRVEQEQALPGEEDAPAANFVAFGYGDCEPEPCPVPVEVQVWAACERNPSVYRLDPRRRIPIARERLTLRGVPAFVYAPDPRLELSTGTVTVVVFATGGPAQLLDAAAALRAVNRGVTVGEPLPPPAAGAVGGTLECPD